VYFWVRITTGILEDLNHSQLDWNFGFVGRWILVSPAAHRLHHSGDPKHFGKNFGNSFIFWDRLFGTYHPPEAVTRFGLPDNPYNQHNFVYDIALGYKRFLWSLAGKTEAARDLTTG
jgi:sterol desaturase/sphingolipid hydroxylase (fatty acid hydroxylase superfamily)